MSSSSTKSISTRHTPLPEPSVALPRHVLGLRVDALIEIISLLALMVAADLLFGRGDGFSKVSPHPFWAVVLLAASYYGTREGLAAVAFSFILLLLAQPHHDNTGLAPVEWPLGATEQLLAWGIAGLVFGEIRDAWRRRTETLREELNELRKHARAVTEAHRILQLDKEHLESRVAGQLCTVTAMYKASRAIGKQGVGDVLTGVGELVRRVLAPKKFSLFLLNGLRLEASISEGWEPDESFSREFDETSPLYRAVVTSRRHLSVVDVADEPILVGEGVLAGPVTDSNTGTIIGMLKIEEIDFLELHPSGVQNFSVLCEWIGWALVNAQQFENQLLEPSDGSGRRLRSALEFEADREMFRSLAAQAGLSGQVLHIAIDTQDFGDGAAAAWRSRIVATLAQRPLKPNQRCYGFDGGEWPYAIMLPGSTSVAAEAFAQDLATGLAAAYSDMSVQPVFRCRIEPI
jgi:polysaccharide biosynthesis protein PelD